MNVKRVIEEDTERLPFYSRGQLFTFHISFAHNLCSLYNLHFIRTHPVFTLHFAFHSHKPVFPFVSHFIHLHPVFT